jgi:hypothetical protein
MTLDLKRALLLIGVGLVSAVLTVLALNLLRGGNPGAGALNIGDCLDAPAGPAPQVQITRKSCSEEHDGEVFAVVAHTAPAGAPYPDAAEFRDLASDECVPELQSYTGMDILTFVAQGFDFAGIYPAPEQWNGGARGVSCYVIRADGSKMTRSIRSAGAPSQTL